MAVAEPERVRALFTAPAGHPRPHGQRPRPGAAAGTSSGQPTRAAASTSPAATARPKPSRPRSARHARTSRAAAASRSRDQADRLAQPRHRADVRARARLSRRLGGDRLRVSRTARSASGPTRQPAPERLTQTAHLHPLAHRHDRAFKSRVDPARGARRPAGPGAGCRRQVDHDLQSAQCADGGDLEPVIVCGVERFHRWRQHHPWLGCLVVFPADQVAQPARQTFRQSGARKAAPCSRPARVPETLFDNTRPSEILLHIGVAHPSQNDRMQHSDAADQRMR